MTSLIFGQHNSMQFHSPYVITVFYDLESVPHAMNLRLFSQTPAITNLKYVHSQTPAMTVHRAQTTCQTRKAHLLKRIRTLPLLSMKSYQRILETTTIQELEEVKTE